MTALEQPPTTPDPGLRCSPWTRAQHVDPIGSAGAFDALILVEWPLPWPADVADIPELAAASAAPGVRLMTVVPQHDEGIDGCLRVVHRRRTGTNHLSGIDHRVLRTKTKKRVFAKISKSKNSKTLSSYIGLLKHGNTQKVKSKILELYVSNDD